MPVYDQGYQVGAKFGTIFYSESATGDFAELAVDLSQEGLNLDDNGSSASVYSDARFNRAAPRTVHVRATLNLGSSGTLFAKGDLAPADPDLHLYVTSGVIYAAVNGSDLGSLGVSAGITLQLHHIAWVTEPNPDATGAGDAELSWLVAYNTANARVSRAGPFVHEAADNNEDIAVWGAVDEDNDDAYSGTISRCGFHHRAMTLREVYNDHVSTAAAPTTVVSVDRETIPMNPAMGLGNVDQCYGPTHAWAARNGRGLDRRTVTARHERFPSLVLSNSYLSSDEEWIWEVPDTGGYTAHLGHLMAVPVPPNCNRLWVRVHAKLWVTSGSAVPTGIRIYSANRPPLLAVPAGAEPFESTYIGSLTARDDGVFGVGVWSTPQLLPITRGSSQAAHRRGWTYVFPAFVFDPGDTSANDANARVQFNAIQLVPCQES